MREFFKDFAYCRLTAAAGPADTVLTVDTITRLPSDTQLSTGTFWMNLGGSEMIRLVSTSGSTITVERAQQGTTAIAQPVGSFVKHVVPAGAFVDMRKIELGPTLPAYDANYMGDGDVAIIDSNGQFNVLVAGVWKPLAAGGSFLTVAASDSDPKYREFAAYVCDGTDDEVQIQAAFDSIPTAVGGTVHLFPGTYNINFPIIMAGDLTAESVSNPTRTPPKNLQGEGYGTLLRRQANAPAHTGVYGLGDNGIVVVRGCHLGYIRQCRFDGILAPDRPGVGSGDFWSHGFEISECWFQDFGDGAAISDWASAPNDRHNWFPWHIYDNFFERVAHTVSGGGAIHNPNDSFLPSAIHRITSGFVTQNHFDGCATAMGVSGGLWVAAENMITALGAERLAGGVPFGNATSVTSTTTGDQNLVGIVDALLCFANVIYSTKDGLAAEVPFGLDGCQIVFDNTLEGRGIRDSTVCMANLVRLAPTDAILDGRTVLGNYILNAGWRATSGAPQFAGIAWRSTAASSGVWAANKVVRNTVVTERNPVVTYPAHGIHGSGSNTGPVQVVDNDLLLSGVTSSLLIDTAATGFTTANGNRTS